MCVRSYALASVVFFGLISLALLLAVLVLPMSQMQTGLAFGLLMLCPYVLILWEPGRGTFRLDSEGIQQVAFLRKPRYLCWQDVERVQWRWDASFFEGKGTRISIRWTMVPKRDATQAKAFVEKVLSPHFDLASKPIRQLSFDPNLQSFLVWLGKLIGISIAGTALFMAVFVGILFLNQPWRTWLGVAWIAMFPLGALFIFVPRVSRGEEQTNPTWRLRRQDGSG